MDTAYELYMFSQGRWLLEACFDAARREDAIRTERTIEDNVPGRAVKLVRETFDRRTRAAQETVVYNGQRRCEVREWRKAREPDQAGPYLSLFESSLADTSPAAPPASFVRGGPSGSMAMVMDGAPIAFVMAKVVAIAIASVGLAALAAVVHRGVLTILV